MNKPIIIGALHLPHYGRCNAAMSIAELEHYLMTNCKVFYENGLRTFYIQDENPAPKEATAETIATVSMLGKLIKREYPDVSLGVIVEAHDPVAPIAIAKACGADFVRIKVFVGAMVKGPGIQTGCGIEAVQYRDMIGAREIKIFADAHDRMGFPMANIPITNIANWVSSAGADGIILTGFTYAQSLEYANDCRDVVHGKPRIIGGSVTIDNVREALKHFDGAVVSTSLMLDKDIPNSPLRWDAEKIKRFIAAAYGS